MIHCNAEYFLYIFICTTKISLDTQMLEMSCDMLNIIPISYLYLGSVTKAIRTDGFCPSNNLYIQLIIIAIIIKLCNMYWCYLQWLMFSKVLYAFIHMSISNKKKKNSQPIYIR